MNSLRKVTSSSESSISGNGSLSVGDSDDWYDLKAVWV